MTRRVDETPWLPLLALLGLGAGLLGLGEWLRRYDARLCAFANATGEEA